MCKSRVQKRQCERSEGTDENNTFSLSGETGQNKSRDEVSYGAEGVLAQRRRDLLKKRGPDVPGVSRRRIMKYLTYLRWVDHCSTVHSPIDTLPTQTTSLSSGFWEILGNTICSSVQTVEERQNSGGVCLVLTTFRNVLHVCYLFTVLTDRFN